MYAKILLMTAVLLTGQVYAQTTPSTTPAVVAKKKKKTKPAQATAAAKNEVNSPAVAPVEGVKKEEGKKEEVKVVEPAGPATVIQYMKDHFAASYHGEYYLARRDINSAKEDDHKIQDLNIMHQPTVIYKPSPNWQILATAEFKYTDIPGGADGYPNAYYRSLFTVTRKKVLEEKLNEQKDI